MSIDAGGMFSRQFYFASPLFRQDIMGVNTRIQYALTNNIRLNMWGQYIFPDEEFPFSTYNSLFPHTGVGASVSVDLKKDAEMSVGAEYQYDNKSQNGNWSLPGVSLLVFNDNKTAMKENYIYQILKQFFVNSYPPEIEEKVQKWIINDKWTTEKNKAMSTIWDEVEIAPNDNTYKALDRVKNRIKQIEHSKKHFRIRRVLLGSAAVIIPILLILGSYIYLNQDVQMIEVVTASNQQKQCRLADGTTIVLNSCTKITYPSKFKDTTRVVTLEGEAYFSVASDAEKPFIVKTSNLSVRVLGTKFNISAYPTNDRTIATLNSGKYR